MAERVKTVDEELEADAALQEAPPKDKLDRLRAACAAARDLDLEIQDLESRASAKKKELLEMRYKGLPDLFMSAGVSRVDIGPSGNMPAYEAKLTDHYHANISTSWDPERQDAGLDWLEDHGQGDLIKRTIEINLGRNEEKVFKQVMKVLKKISKIKDRISVQRAVPWNTLTAWLKEKYQNDEELGDADLQTLGAVVGKQVSIKPAKEK
jgi:hypothetical protein